MTDALFSLHHTKGKSREVLPNQTQLQMAGEVDSTRQSDLPSRIPEEIGLELLLATSKALFASRKTVLPRSFERAKAHATVILDRTSKHDHVRKTLGHSDQIWKDINAVFAFAIPMLEVQSIAIDDPATGQPGCCSSLMVSHSDTLMNDLVRLNDILLIGRNCLATTPKAQNLAGESLLDQQVLKLIDLCIRVTARGYDGEAGGAGTKTEKVWGAIIGLCKFSAGHRTSLPNASVGRGFWTDWLLLTDKKLLISCLQFLHNFIIQNEQRKLLLWLDLFANSRLANEYVAGGPPPGREQMRDMFEAKLAEVQNNAKANGHTSQDQMQDGSTGDHLNSKDAGSQKNNAAPMQQNTAKNTIEDNRLREDQGQQEEITQPVNDQKESSNSSTTISKDTDEALSQSIDRKEDAEAQHDRALEQAKSNFGALRSPESAAVTLKAAKDQLMARLKESARYESEADRATARAAYKEMSEADQEAARATLDYDEPPDDGLYPDEEDEEYRDQGELGDQTRGLLTDIPLVLGPQEIEALPMIIQIAICPGLGSVLHGRDMQSLRCNILLAGEAGRNLLRELLIFIAAWDLQDDEMYFTLMKQIMEAILENGLMPYAYQTFAEVKDIVSPAQSMVIKILTQIFRGKHGLAIEKGTGKDLNAGKDNLHADATRRVDIYIVRYIFTMFRSSIIPETCALIYLQGQIKAGAALPEDFPLNLWDMERVYEGVYQFLEFFAVLTESEQWKDHLVEWEIVSELVTLLRELDASIPKAPLAPLSQSLEEQQAPILQKERLLAEAYATATQNQKPATNAKVPSQSSPAPAVAVERPWSPEDSAATKINQAAAAMVPNALPSAASSTLSQNQSISETGADVASIESADPAEFEWRNLKKLVILVLSSLVWKSPKVQTQIRQYGGVELVLGCCNYDGHNPYIREHAVMCLRFLLEGNVENQEIIRERMARREGLGGVLGEDLAGEVLGQRGDFEEEDDEDEEEGEEEEEEEEEGAEGE